MAFAAIFAAMNTMYAAVSARTTEIGTLRALDQPAAIMTSFLGGVSRSRRGGIIGVISPCRSTDSRPSSMAVPSRANLRLIFM